MAEIASLTEVTHSIQLIYKLHVAVHFISNLVIQRAAPCPRPSDASLFSKQTNDHGAKEDISEKESN